MGGFTQLRQADVRQAIDEIRRKLDRSIAAVTLEPMYTDSVIVYFKIEGQMSQCRELIRDRFDELSKKHGWQLPHVGRAYSTAGNFDVQRVVAVELRKSQSLSMSTSDLPE